MAVLLATSISFTILTVLIWVVLLGLGIIGIRKGHWVMFILGIFIPPFWLIGGLLPRRRR